MPPELPEQQLSKKAQGMLGDANGLIKRLGTYMQSIPKNSAPIDEQLMLNQSALSVIEGLGAKIIRENAPKKDIDNLVHAMHSYEEECLKLTENPREKAKISLNSAKAEAALRGFILPLSLGGPADELDLGKLTQEELIIPMEATKTALLELSNKSIPPEEYAQRVIEKANGILAASGKFSADKLVEFGKIVEQGKKTQKPSNLSEDENKLIAEAATRGAQNFVTFFKENTNKITSDTFKRSVAQHDAAAEASRIITESVKSFSIDEVHTKKITDKLMHSLTQLGYEYLKEHRAVITDELTNSLEKEKSFSARIPGMGYTISKASLDMISDKVQKTHGNAVKMLEARDVIFDVQKLSEKDRKLAIETFRSFSVQKTEGKHHEDLIRMNPRAFADAVAIVKKESKANMTKNTVQPPSSTPQVNKQGARNQGR